MRETVDLARELPGVRTQVAPEMPQRDMGRGAVEAPSHYEKSEDTSRYTYCPKHEMIGVPTFDINIYNPITKSKRFCLLCYMEYLEKNVTEVLSFSNKKELEFHFHKERMVEEGK